jgi:hypothetical protein
MYPFQLEDLKKRDSFGKQGVGGDNSKILTQSDVVTNT